MRIDGCRRHANDFEFALRKPFTKQRLQVAACSISRARITLRGRFSEEKNPAGVGSLFRRHQNRRWTASKLRRKETQTELLILDHVLLMIDSSAPEKRRR